MICLMLKEGIFYSYLPSYKSDQDLLIFRTLTSILAVKSESYHAIYCDPLHQFAHCRFWKAFDEIRRLSDGGSHGKESCPKFSGRVGLILMHFTRAIFSHQIPKFNSRVHEFKIGNQQFNVYFVYLITNSGNVLMKIGDRGCRMA